MLLDLADGIGHHAGRRIVGPKIAIMEGYPLDLGSREHVEELRQVNVPDSFPERIAAGINAAPSANGKTGWGYGSTHDSAS